MPPASALPGSHGAQLTGIGAHHQRLRHQLREYFPAALEAFEDLAAPDALELLARVSGLR